MNVLEIMEIALSAKIVGCGYRENVLAAGLSVLDGATLFRVVQSHAYWQYEQRVHQAIRSTPNMLVYSQPRPSFVGRGLDELVGPAGWAPTG